MQQPKGLANRWVDLSSRHPKKVLGAALMCSIIAIYLASGLKIRGDFAALLPNDYPSVKGFEIITEKVGGLGFMMVVVEGQTANQVLKITHKLSKQYKTLRSVIRNVQYHQVPPFVKERLLYYAQPKDVHTLYTRLQKLKAYIQAEHKRQNPMVIDLDESSEKKKSIQRPTFDDLLKKYKLNSKMYEGSGLIGTPDGKLSVILLQPNGLESDLKFIKKMVHALRDTTQTTLAQQKEKLRKGIQIHYTGRYMVRYEDDQALQKQLTRITFISLSGVLLLLFFATRRKRSLLLIGAPLLFGVIWTGGMAWILSPGGEINIVTAFIVAVLFGLGIDFGIHLFTRYQTERLGGQTLHAALGQALHSTGAAGLIAVLTSASAFFIIQLTELKGISQFGQIAGVGLLCILTSMLTTFPALAAWFEQRSPMEPTERELESPIHSIWLPFKAKPIVWKLGLALGGLLIIGGGTVVATGSIQFENNLWRLITQGKAVRIYDRLKKDVFKGELEPSVMLFSSHASLKRFQKKADQQMKAGKWSTVRSTLSVHSLVPSLDRQKQTEQQLKKIRVLLRDKAFRNLSDDDEEQIEDLRKLANMRPFTSKDVPQQLRMFLGGGHPLLYLIPGINPTQLDKGRQYAQQLVSMAKTLKQPGEKIWIGDSNLILSDMIYLVKRDGVRSVGFVVVAVLIILLLALRRQKWAIWLVLSPLAVGFSAMFILMWWFEIKLNPFNVVMLPVTLGIGIDHGVYIYYHWHEDKRILARSQMGPVFYAVLLASITSLVGFGSLTLATHKGIYSIGLLAALGILCCTVTAFVVLPSLFTWLQRQHANTSE